MGQIPGLVEKSEPALESALRTAIQQMSKYPAEAALFQRNWRKLNSVVDSELSKIVPTAGKRTKTSRRVRRHK